MQLLTKKGFEALVKRLMMKSQIDDELESDIQALRDYHMNASSSLGYVETEDEEDTYEYEPSGTDVDGYKSKYEDLQKRNEELETNYNELKTRYTDKFFGTDNTENIDIDEEELEEEQIEIEDLFEESEDE